MDRRRAGREVLIRLDRGDEIISSILHVCREEGIKSALVQGIGAASRSPISTQRRCGTIPRHSGACSRYSP